MTISSSESSLQENHPFASLYPHAFFVLTTYRKNGEAVPTTVWFAPDDAGHLYVTTQESSGKAKRIRNNGEVRMTPSDARGTLTVGATPITGYARQLAHEDYERAEAVLVRKYGEQYTSLVGRDGPAAATRTFIEIRPEPVNV